METDSAQMGLRPALKSLPPSPPLLDIGCLHGGVHTWQKFWGMARLLPEDMMEEDRTSKVHAP
jgi:hypothetical protein